MSETILLVDGMYLAFSSFYSHRNMNTLEGEPTGAVYGFITRIESLIKELSPQKIAVAFDSREPNFRARLYPEYKGKRQLPPEDLLAQLPRIGEYLLARGIERIEIPGFEADDIIALLAKNHAGAADVWIFTADKDLFQLIGDSVFIYHPRTKQKIDREGLKEFFGVYPEQIVDYLMLVGDASDNIPGIPGVGEKTALKLIEKYGNIERMVEELGTMEAKTAERFRSHRDLFAWTRPLLDLERIPDPPAIPPLEPFRDLAGEPLRKLYEALAFHSLLTRMSAPKAAAEKAPAGPPLVEVKLVTSRREWPQLRQRIAASREFAIDVETTDLEFHRSRIVGLSIAFPEVGYYIPFLVPETEQRKPDFTIADFAAEFGDILADPRIGKIGHNIKFDLLHLQSQGIGIAGWRDDTMLVSYLLYPNRRTHGLKDLTRECLHHNPTEYQELVGKGKAAMPLPEVPLERIGRYCIEDSYLSLKLAERLKPELVQKNLTELYENLEMPLVEVLAAMEWAGIRIDCDYLERAGRILNEKIGACEEEICGMAGYRFNLNSSQQLGELLFERMNLPMGKKTRKTKAYSTDIEVLSELQGFPIVARIIEYRTYKKLLSTYVEGLAAACTGAGRVHTSFNQTVTATGRLSSSNPNLQNIPVGETGGVHIRRAFIAREGWRLLAADYSQIELRVMAHFSGDPQLIDAFARGMDIHQHTADRVFGILSKQPEMRRRAKIINFSILYGSGAFSLSKELGVGISEAKSFIDAYFDAYRGVRAWIDRTIAAAEIDPEVRTLAGRIRPIPEIQSQNRTIKENGNRMAINTIIQGSAADIIKKAMIEVHKGVAGMESRMLMQVHDELVFEYPSEEEAKLIRLVRDKMENACELRVPMTISLKSGANWADLHPVHS